MIVLGHALLTVTLIVQTNPGVDIDIGTMNGLLGGAITAFLTTLVVGAILVAVVPEFTERMMGDMLEDPIGSFVYGIVSLLALGLLILLLFITIVGILVAVPLFFVVYLVWAIGGAIAYLAIADRLVDRDDGWLKPLLVAAGISGALTATGVGGLLSICIGAAGFGAVLRGYFG
ncbi:hypothetical protein CP556_01935 [Natrinema sp. CBA1119]|uniref:hypothetical protein n=1 Tax=Natrinema sp. CBA1119 TaxID=1608465 RepID=UPI000BF5E222|nr:hypothetical protein [Natrinema sp. CBA1119]PGF15009.1 hypothetical protein CP556_01935 [Natrinema sp. CBA1119]